MKKKKQKEEVNLIDDWMDLVCILGLDFMLILIGVLLIPQVPAKAQMIFALSIVCAGVYFTKKIIYFILFKFDIEI